MFHSIPSQEPWKGSSFPYLWFHWDPLLHTFMHSWHDKGYRMAGIWEASRRNISDKLREKFGTSLAIQEVRLCASTVGDAGSTPAQGTRILHAMPPKKQNTRNKNKTERKNLGKMYLRYCVTFHQTFLFTEPLKRFLHLFYGLHGPLFLSRCNKIVWNYNAEKS